MLVNEHLKSSPSIDNMSLNDVVNLLILPRASVDDGIEQVREILPRCVFDEHKCDEGISHLENYRKEWDDKRGCWKDRPLHDHTSHGADAFRYLANSQTKRHKAKRVNISTVY